jgi:predicted DsbA family dithiol-disulfide isomerase
MRSLRPTANWVVLVHNDFDLTHFTPFSGHCTMDRTPPRDPNVLMIDIVSDVVCPWCFIGKHRLAQALDALRAERPEIKPLIRWRPYFLNPDTPEQGEPYRPFLEKKFGGPQKVADVLARVAQAGRSAGVEFDFERITVRPNTLRAHRLIHWAQQHGEADGLVERIFRGHFQLGEHIGEIATLVPIAAECGLQNPQLPVYLASDTDATEVRQQAEAAQRGGITGVPFFILNGKLGVAGAQTPDLLLEAIGQSLAG